MSTFFAEAYRGTPPWDIGRHQPVFEQLEDAGEIAGPVLDVGCGTGENTLFLAARGHETVGVDAVELAVRSARHKAARRGLHAEFLVHDALTLDELGRRFATVIDSGLFHSLSDAERPRFAESLAAALEPGGRYFMLCFSELETRNGGPRRVTQVESAPASTMRRSGCARSRRRSWRRTSTTAPGAPGWRASSASDCRLGPAGLRLTG